MSVNKRVADPYQGLNPREVPAYTVFDVARYLQIPERTVRNWTFGYAYPTKSGSKRAPGIVEPADKERHLLSFVNFLELHVIDVMRGHHGLDVQGIRRAYQFLQQHFSVKHPFADVDLETDGVELFFRHIGHLVSASSYGQVSLKEMMRIHLDRIERDPTGLGTRLFLFIRRKKSNPEERRREPRIISMDPLVSFGRPVIVGSRLATSDVAERYKAGDSIANLVSDYGRPTEEIEEAIRCELTLEAA
jgi:uncharacterized protein (DUF433 family)